MKKIYGYDGLCQMVTKCITATTYQAISECSSLLIVAINEEARMKKCMDKLFANNPEIKPTFIAQPSMEPVLREWYGDQYQIIGWKGNYTLELVELLQEKTQLSLLDGFLYFTEQPVNMRDENFTLIAQKLQDIADVHVFSNTIGEDLYEYHNLALYNQAIKVYEEINRLIDVVLEQRGG